MDMSSRMGARAKVNPPLRKREDRQALFQALKSGEFDIIASDHAPHTIEEKEEEFDYAPTGMPGVETLAPLMLQLVKERHLDLWSTVKRLCQSPGEIFGVNKGRIAVGYDADLMAVDMTGTTSIDVETLHSKCGWTAFEGMHAIFPKTVFLRGQLMVEDGGLVGERSGRDAVGPH
jgi:dihydroorotase